MPSYYEKIPDTDKKCISNDTCCLGWLILVGFALIGLGFLNVNSSMRELATKGSVLEVKNLFIDTEKYVPKRLNILRKVTDMSVFCGEKGVSVDVYLHHNKQSLFASVTVAHQNCDGMRMRHPDESINAFVCHDINDRDLDIMLQARCPVNGYALNITKAVPMIDSEKVVVYGGGMSWTGNLMGLYSKDLLKSAGHFRGPKHTIVNVDEAEVAGAQHDGQSGSFGLGECGVLGSAHAVSQNRVGVLFVGGEDIKRCIVKYANHFDLGCKAQVENAPSSSSCPK